MAAEMLALFQATFERWPPSIPASPCSTICAGRPRGRSPASRRSRLASTAASPLPPPRGRAGCASAARAASRRLSRRRHGPGSIRAGASTRGRWRYRAAAGRASSYDLSLHEQGTSDRQEGSARPPGSDTLVANTRLRASYRILRPFAFCAERRRLWLLPAAIALAARQRGVAAARRGARRRA